MSRPLTPAGRPEAPKGSGLLRLLAKRIVEQVVLIGSRPFVRPFGGARLVLAYHNVVPDEFGGLGDTSLHLSVSSFRAQVALLQTHCDIVPLEDLLATPKDPPRPRVAITFDDAYRGAVELGLGELRRVGLPATVFVSPALLGQGAPWWDLLGSSEHEWNDEVRERAIVDCKGDTSLVRAAFALDSPAVGLPEHFHIATMDELLHAIRDGRFALASHTWSHRNVATLSDQELRDEYRRPLAWLAAAPAPSIPWLAYPYGRYSASAAAAARDAGYAAGLRVDGGWLPELAGDRFTLPRLNVPAGLTSAGFELRIRRIGDAWTRRGR